MTRLVLSILISITFISCATKHDRESKTGILSNLVSITDNENNGINEILDYYGGECKYSLGFEASTETGNKKNFVIEIRKSDAIEKNANRASMPASNIAYLFYKNLREEKNNYDEIHTTLVFNDGEKLTYKYPVEKLVLVKNKIQLAYKVVNIIKKKNFKELGQMLSDSSFIKYDKNELLNNIEGNYQMFGNVQEFRPFGFRFDKHQNDKEVLQISGAVIRDKNNHEFSIDVDPKSINNEILLMRYEF